MILTERMMKFVYKNSVLIIILLFSISICMMYYTNQYDISSVIVQSINKESIEQKTIWYLSNKTLLLNILGIVFLNMSVALFISFFFIRYIEKNEKKDFYLKLQEFQKETAKDAIKSVFERIIDDNLFSVIEQDILNANFLRENAQWDFDILENSEGKLELKRILTYHLKNITTKDQEETFLIQSSNNNIHSSVYIESCKYKVIHEKDYQLLDFKSEEENKENTFEVKNKIDVKANSEVQVVIIFKTVSMHNYLYETHSIRFPIIGISLTVNYPKDYEFEIVVQSFSNKLEEISNSDGKKKYETKKANYKGQGIEFLCYKKR